MAAEEPTPGKQGRYLSRVERTKDTPPSSGGTRPKQEQICHRRIESTEVPNHFMPRYYASSAESSWIPACATTARSPHRYTRNRAGDLDRNQPAEGGLGLNDDDPQIGRSLRPAVHQRIKILHGAAGAALDRQELCEVGVESSHRVLADRRGASACRSAHEDASPRLSPNEAEPRQLRVRRVHGVPVKTEEIRQPPAAGQPPTRVQLTGSDRRPDLCRELPSQRDRVARRECQISNRIRQLGSRIRAADGLFRWSTSFRRRFRAPASCAALCKRESASSTGFQLASRRSEGRHASKRRAGRELPAPRAGRRVSACAGVAVRATGSRSSGGTPLAEGRSAHRPSRARRGGPAPRRTA